MIVPWIGIYQQVIHKKYRISYDDIAHDLCPVSPCIGSSLLPIIDKIFDSENFECCGHFCRSLVSSNFIEYVHCTGMTATTQEVYHKM